VLSRRLVDLKGSVVTVECRSPRTWCPTCSRGVDHALAREEGGIETGDDPGRPNARIGLVKLNVEKKTKRLAVTVKRTRRTTSRVRRSTSAWR